MIENTLRTVVLKPIVQPAVVQVASQTDQIQDERRHLARIKRAIRRKTCGGVQALAVEMEQGTLRLRGHCASFYCKQVAQQAAMSFLPGQTIINEIEVDVRPH